MKLIVDYANVNDYPRIEEAYYNFFCALEGPSLVAPVTRRILSKGNEPSQMLFLLDPNLGASLDAVNQGFGDNEKICMLEVKNENGYIIAYARIHWDINQDGKNASIPDVAIVVPMNEYIATEFYYSFLDAVEEFIKTRNEEIEKVTAEVPINNDAYLEAISYKQDYQTFEKPTSNQRTILYDKWLRNRPKVRQKVDETKFKTSK